MSLKSVQTTCIEWADNLNVMFYLHDCLCKEWETVNFCTEFEWWPRSVIKNVSSHVYWNDDISIYPFISAIFFKYPMDDNIKIFLVQKSDNLLAKYRTLEISTKTSVLLKRNCPTWFQPSTSSLFLTRDQYYTTLP